MPVLNEAACVMITVKFPKCLQEDKTPLGCGKLFFVLKVFFDFLELTDPLQY